MNFTQMHERLRLELLRRINRGTLSVSLLARQTGFGQSHLSNFLHSKRQLSLQTLDRVMSAQHLAADDLMILGRHTVGVAEDHTGKVLIVAHAATLFEPYIRPAVVQSMLQVPQGMLHGLRPHTTKQRRAWQRFAAARVSRFEALAMEPLVRPNAIVLVDRHYNSLASYQPDRLNIYAVRHGPHLFLRHVDFLANRLVLRPHQRGSPVELMELGLHESPGDLIAGRIALIVNEM